MKIHETRSGFTNIGDIGIYSFFIITDIKGAYVKSEDIVEKAQHFRSVVFKSINGDVFDFKEDIEVVVKKLKKINPMINITFHTDGTIKPKGINKYDNIFYNTFLKLKASNIPYEIRIKDSPIKFFREANTRFIFECFGEDDIDEINVILTSHELKKEQIFINPKDGYDKILTLCKMYGYNICLEVDEAIFEVKDE